MPLDCGRTLCFINDSNIYNGQRNAGWRIDWKRFQAWVERDGPVWQTWFFTSKPDGASDRDTDFHQFLQDELRWEVLAYALGRRTVERRHCHVKDVVPAEKGVDVGVTTKMLILGINKAYDTALLLSGDRDDLETVEFIKNLGLRVEVMAWRNSLSHDLAEEVSEPVVYFDDLREEISFAPRA